MLFLLILFFVVNFDSLDQNGVSRPIRPKLAPLMSEHTGISVYSDYTEDKDEKIQNGMTSTSSKSNCYIEIHNRAAQWMSEINSQDERESQ